MVFLWGGDPVARPRWKLQLQWCWLETCQWTGEGTWVTFRLSVSFSEGPERGGVHSIFSQANSQQEDAELERQCPHSVFNRIQLCRIWFVVSCEWVRLRGSMPSRRRSCLAQDWFPDPIEVSDQSPRPGFIWPMDHPNCAVLKNSLHENHMQFQHISPGNGQTPESQILSSLVLFKGTSSEGSVEAEVSASEVLTNKDSRKVHFRASRFEHFD